MKKINELGGSLPQKNTRAEPEVMSKEERDVLAREYSDSLDRCMAIMKECKRKKDEEVRRKNEDR